jgi:hypothetical protein
MRRADVHEPLAHMADMRNAYFEEGKYPENQANKRYSRIMV